MVRIYVKDFYKSKTFWFGILSILLAIANSLGFADYQPDSKVNEAIELINGLAIIALRFKTTNSIKFK